MDINIDGVPYSFKQRLTIEEWQSLIRLDFQNVKDWPQIIHIVTTAPLYYLQQASEDVMGIAIGIVIKQMDERRQLQLPNFESLNFGEFVDLDVYINLGVDRHINEMLEVLKITTQWADEAIYAIEQYQKYRTYIYRQYKSLFGLDEKDFVPQEETQQDSMKVAREWYKIIVSLANDDITKLDEITSQPLKKVLNFMALQKEQRLAEERKQLELKRQYDLQRNRR